MLICRKELLSSSQTRKLGVERSKGATETEAEVLKVKWGSRRAPRIKRPLWMAGFSSLCSRSHVMTPTSDAQEAP